MRQIRRLCVYCGSSGAVDERYRAAARELGELLAKAEIELVYGGGRVGLMGIIADAVLVGGGRVTGVIPRRLSDAEIAHLGSTELIVVSSMHERKHRMFEMSDAFAVLPGGFGTLDEAFEIITWRKLGLHDKPVFLLDIAGYWRPLQALVDHVVGQGFASPLDRQLYTVVTSVEALIPALAAAPRPKTGSQPERL